MMRLGARARLTVWMLGAGASLSASGQTVDSLKLQVHGYATQGFIYSTDQDWNTTNSSDGSGAYTEAVLNVTAQPVRKLRVGAQARYFLLGQFGNKITLDWAQGDYKVNEWIGVRGGKVKTPVGLLNDSQDIDPAFLWVLLPQSIYPLASRTSTLAHYGGVVYGTISMGDGIGKLMYRGFGGERTIPAGDAYLQATPGLSAPDGLKGPAYGADLKWKLPVSGLLLSASFSVERPHGTVLAGPLTGTLQSSPFVDYYYSGSYERSRFQVSGEYRRLPVQAPVSFPGLTTVHRADQRSFYAMTSYKVAKKLTAGVYYSSSLDRAMPVGAGRYQKDWALAARYDFNSFLYLKGEQHIMDGTEIGFFTNGSLNDLNPSTRMTLLKVGVSF